jgi:hypothetical protein
MAPRSQTSRQGDRGGGLANTTFLVAYCNDLHLKKILTFN